MSRKRIVLIALAALVASPFVLIALGSFMPVWVTSYMLQSPTRPVQHQWVPRERIADAARRAVVAAEDQKFWNHHGFDMEAMQKAYERNQRGGRVRGGSTISQQTAKNLFLWPGGGYFRKGLEAGLTMVIEALWSKERILEVYLNSAEFGPGIYGVEAASRRFFRKPAAELSSSEAARLAAVLPSPRRWKVDAPGPYVRTRAAWIQRQMGYVGRAPAAADDEPDLPPGERFDEDETTVPPAETPPAETQTANPPATEPAPEPAATAEPPASPETEPEQAPQPAAEPAADPPAEPAPND
ncbi:MAG: monofunctional biosynthetic peptidoglycan transglycosylase [Hydrocarboniphaga sp.]|uniref:Biosynthetic peptidoglycan transglycosylase n=1 Tax=Hydrocarboniphaga effusa AP103 TaxID=1172194 RepID=I8TD64_9GAMM|nr:MULTISPECIES: monofunctional biosynthetic peptidoglycan transglycosylase [Hydrocarboniphaga]EIT71633.1 hypothetical protein WQQ_17700 [Hydrocarboniphaga effusa AP103]MDZ4080260.1 monofunctional biosynthetic peptidoglycan transglycosylase [Hydrocarboniphaga sp.]